MKLVSMNKEAEMEGLTGDGRTRCGIFGEVIAYAERGIGRKARGGKIQRKNEDDDKDRSLIIIDSQYK